MIAPLRPRVTAFYAYKGGTGRTLALLHTAWALARAGRRVVAVDLDLSAPSLGSLVGHPTAPGVLDLIRAQHAGPQRPLRELLIEVPLDPGARGALFVLPAGAMDESYLLELEQLDLRSLVSSRPPRSRPQRDLYDRPTFFDELFEDLARTIEADAVLLDAPTGLNDTSNLCLRVLSDSVVALFAPTEVQLEGVARIASLLTREALARREAGHLLRPDLACVASTLLHRSGGALHRRIQYCFDYLAKVRYEAIGKPADVAGEAQDTVWQEQMVIPYFEPLAAIDHLDTGTEPRESLFATYEDVIGFVSAGLPERLAPVADLAPERRHRILEELRPRFRPFAEDDAVEELRRFFLRTEHFESVREHRVAVVLGGKGSGKSTLFRYLSSRGEADLVVHGGKVGVSRELLETLWRTVPDRMPDVWRLHLLSKISAELPAPGELVHLHRALVAGDSGRLTAWREAFSKAESALDIAGAWRQLDESLSAQGRTLTLYMDNLDTTFSSDDVRDPCLAALFTGWQATLASLQSISLKVFLRTDIWDRLAYPEKSHALGREKRLSWQEVDLWRLVAKRLFTSDSFSALARERGLSTPEAETVAESAILPHLDLLFDRHVWGGKNSLSRNWILRRLRDTRDTIYPRDLVVLLQEAMKLEVNRARRDRATSEAIISRTALSDALRPTSTLRVSGLREEYPELVNALNALTGKPAVGQLRDLPLSEDQKRQLMDCGVLRSELNDAYSVPDLYRHGLGMPRSGPN